MSEINLHEAKAYLGSIIEKALKGERVIICKRNRPLVELVPVADQNKKNRKLKLGVAKGQFILPDDFNESLEEFEEEFYG